LFWGPLYQPGAFDNFLFFQPINVFFPSSTKTAEKSFSKEFSGKPFLVLVLKKTLAVLLEFLSCWVFGWEKRLGVFSGLSTIFFDFLAAKKNTPAAGVLERENCVVGVFTQN